MFSLPRPVLHFFPEVKRVVSRGEQQRTVESQRVRVGRDDKGY